MIILIDGESVAVGYGGYTYRKQLSLLLPFQMALRDEII